MRDILESWNVEHLLHSLSGGRTFPRTLKTLCKNVKLAPNIDWPKRNSSSFPERPWARLGMDLFELHGKTFLVVVDYYSRWPELSRLDNQTSSNLISKLTSILAVHGIPDVIISDNSPQFASTEFRNFAADFGFTHSTSSPHYPESNGEAERAVQTVKHPLKKSKDPYNALLLYRASPLHNGKSPSELLMGRKLKAKIPTGPFNLLPKTTDHFLIRLKEEGLKEKQRILFNRRHAAREATPLKPGDTVFVKDMKKSGEIIKKHHNPRSYIVLTDSGPIRRNRTHLVTTSNEAHPPGGPTAATNSPTVHPPPLLPPSTPRPSPASTPVQPTTSPAPDIPTLRRSQRITRKPQRLDLWHYTIYNASCHNVYKFSLFQFWQTRVRSYIAHIVDNLIFHCLIYFQKR